jgi:hypothetical protein
MFKIGKFLAQWHKTAKTDFSDVKLSVHFPKNCAEMSIQKTTLSLKEVSNGRDFQNG